MKNQESIENEQEKYAHEITSFEEMGNQDYNAHLSEFYRHMRTLVHHLWDEKNIDGQSAITEVREQMSIIENNKDISFALSPEEMTTQIVESIFVDEKRLENTSLRDWYDEMIIGEVTQDVIDSNPDFISEGYWDAHEVSELLKDMRLGNTHSEIYSGDFYKEEDWAQFTEKIDNSLTAVCQKALEVNSAQYEE